MILNLQFIFRDIQIEEFDSDSVLSDIAARSEGFSGREISKLGIALQVVIIIVNLFHLS